MKTFISLIFSALALTVSAQMPFIQGMMAQSEPASGGITYLFNENCESGSEPTADRWGHGGGGTVNWGQNTVKLEGNYTVSCDATTSDCQISNTLASAVGEIYVKFRWRFNQLESNDSDFFRIQAGATVLFSANIRSTGVIRCKHGTSTSSSTADTYSGGTLYYVWAHYKKASVTPGGDGVGSIAISTTDSEPTTGNSYRAVSNGTATGDATNVRFLADFVTLGIIDYYDVMQGSESVIGPR